MVRGTVDHGEFQTGDGGQQLPHPGPGDERGDHRARGGPFLHQPPAPADQPHRVLRVQRPGHAERRVRADAVPGDPGRGDPDPFPQPGLGELEGEQGGLREGGVPARGALPADDPAEEVVPPGLLRVHPGARRQHLGHHREARGESGAHARVAAALPAEQEHRRRVPYAVGDPGRVRLARRGPGQERLQSGDRVRGRDDQPVRQESPPERGGGQQIGGEGRAPPARWSRRAVAYARSASPSTADSGSSAGTGTPPTARGPRHGLRGLLQDHVSVRAAHADGVHTGPPHPRQRPAPLPYRQQER